MQQAHKVVDRPSAHETRRSTHTPVSNGLSETLRFLWRRRAIIALTFAVSFALAYLALTSLTPHYTATAKIMVDPRQPKVIDLGEVMSGLPANMETVQGEIEIITSAALAAKVVSETNLAAIPEFTAPTPEQLLANYQDALRVRPAGRSRVIDLSFTSADPRLAVQVANTAANLYLSNQRDARFESTLRASKWLAERLEQLRAEAENAEEAVAALKAQQQNSPRLETLEREAAVSRSLYQTFLERAKQTGEQMDLAASGLTPSDARLISPATTPAEPSFPNKSLILLLALAGGLGFGLLLSALAEQLEHGFKSSEEVEEDLGLPVLALIPSLRSLGIKGVAPEQLLTLKPASAYAESIRILRTALHLNETPPAKTILFTSALPGEGKTTAVLSLARHAAEAGERVLVLDADSRRPRVHEALKMESGAGLSDVLLGRIPLEKAILALGPKGRGLHVLPAGEANEIVNLLGSTQMAALLQRLAKLYSLILIDSPPTLPVADARLLAQFADQVVMVVKWNASRREVVAHAVKQFTGVRVKGVVLNQVDIRRHAEYSYGDSGTYYGQHRSYFQN